MRFSMLAVALAAVSGVVLGQDADQKPVDSGLVEQTERRLMQIDVTVRGPAETVSALTEKDFTLTVGRRDISEFVLDRVCIDNTIDALDLDLDRSTNAEVADTLPRLRTLLYFDQTHLTSLGRQRSIELAKELIPQLLERGRSEVMIVTASHRLEVASEWSGDRDVLLAAVAAVAAVAADLDQVSTWANLEEARIAQLMVAIDRVTELKQNAIRDYNRGERAKTREGLDTVPDPGAAMALDSARTMARIAARDLSRAEAAATARGLELFTVALQYLDSYAPPKAVVYFADTMRANAGDFYIDLVRAFDGKRRGEPQRDEVVILSSGNYLSEYQRAIDVATEKGVRFYTVQGRGLAPQPLVRSRIGSARPTSQNPQAGRARFKDAENALSGFARETGGKSFLGAADGTQIASQILDDLSCLFVLSFHPVDLPENRSSSVWIDVDKPGIKLKYRPHVLALGDEARKKERLASAFWSGSRSSDEARLVAVPTGFEGGKYTVLLQFAIPGSELSEAAWDMGVTAVVGRNRTIEESGRVSVDRPGVPLVFEAEMRFKPGDFTITAVAKDSHHGQLISTKVDGSLPDPQDSDAFVASIAMLQRAPGAFVRGGQSKTSGSLAQGSEHWLRPDRPTGILALVCGEKRADPVTAGRTLKGAAEVSFDGVDLDFHQERCGLLVDTIDSDIMTSGKFTYTVDLKRGAETLERSQREFLVVSPEEIALIRGEATGQND